MLYKYIYRSRTADDKKKFKGFNTFLLTDAREPNKFYVPNLQSSTKILFYLRVFFFLMAVFNYQQLSFFYHIPYNIQYASIHKPIRS